MLESKKLIARTAGRFLSLASVGPHSQASTQRRLMVIALSLLMVALIFVLYHDREFWFPDGQEADDETQQAEPATVATSPSSMAARTQPLSRKSHANKAHLSVSAQPQTATPPIVATTTRTVLPPLEVEVVAGDSHRTMQPGSNAVNLDVAPDSLAEDTANSAPAAEETAANVTDKAAERVEMSPDTSEMVSQPVKPGYPMLARQMKVQGSVILLAMIGRDGMIQDLRVLSGPPILSGAAREAVKQWHFKPHFEGKDTVETVAKITVNFTISTN